MEIALFVFLIIGFFVAIQAIRLVAELFSEIIKLAPMFFLLLVLAVMAWLSWWL